MVFTSALLVKLTQLTFCYKMLIASLGLKTVIGKVEHLNLSRNLDQIPIRLIMCYLILDIPVIN